MVTTTITHYPMDGETATPRPGVVLPESVKTLLATMVAGSLQERSLEVRLAYHLWDSEDCYFESNVPRGMLELARGSMRELLFLSGDEDGPVLVHLVASRD